MKWLHTFQAMLHSGTELERAGRGDLDMCGVLSWLSWHAEQTMRRMIEAAELKNQRTIAPEAHSMHLTPDTDPASTFRLRNMGNRPRLDELQFSMSSPPGSTQVTHC